MLGNNSKSSYLCPMASQPLRQNLIIVLVYSQSPALPHFMTGRDDTQRARASPSHSGSPH